MNILIHGLRGSGKTTQAKLLAETLNLNQIDTGTMFRESFDTDAGRSAKEYMDKGMYVPEKIVFQMLKEYIDKTCDKSKDFVFTGFPRTLAQIPYMENELSIKIDKVFELKVRINILMERMEKRKTLENRHDETPEAIKMRLTEDEKKAGPVLEYYRDEGIVEEVDGEKTIEEIQEDIMKKIRG